MNVSPQAIAERLRRVKGSTEEAVYGTDPDTAHRLCLADQALLARADALAHAGLGGDEGGDCDDEPFDDPCDPGCERDYNVPENDPAPRFPASRRASP